MYSNFLVVTIPQWAIFAGITIMVYGWTEKKKVFEMIGSALFVLSGIFATYALISGLLIPEGLLKTGAIMDGEELFSPDELPLEGRLLPVYWGMVATGAIALGHIVTGILNFRAAPFLKWLAMVLNILLFFALISVVRV